MLNPVLIVGAGPVGLTAAAALQSYGVQCRLIDKSPVPTDQSKAIVVWCRTLELLDKLGLAEKLIENGLKLTGASVYAGRSRLVHLNLTSDETEFGFPLVIPQNETERLLTEYLADKNVTVERKVELVTFSQTADEVSCTLRHADGQLEEVTAPWVIGCDGAHSTVRHTLGWDFVGKTDPNEFMLADVDIDGPLSKSEISVFWHDDGVIAFFPLNAHRFRMLADLGTATAQNSLTEVTLAQAQGLADRRGPGGLTLSNPYWLSCFRINERKVSKYFDGRVLLAGDAAHIHSPAGGQGMNTGMQDAFNLAWKLALIQRAQGKSEPLLQSYTIERSAVGDQVLKSAERFTMLATLRSPAARWLRNHIIPILGSFPVVQDRIRNEWFELSINYRHSPLTADHGPRVTGGLSAGDRLCDAPLTSATDSSSSRLFPATNTRRHVLLLLPGSDDQASAAQLIEIAKVVEEVFPELLSPLLIVGKEDDSITASQNIPVWIDSEGTLHERLHANTSTLIVVRPDGYLGFRCQPADRQRLLTFLGSYLIRDRGVTSTIAP